MSFLTYLAGGVLLASLVRWWRPGLGWGWMGAYWLLAGAFFVAPLTTDALQVPTDILYTWQPWREMSPIRTVPENALLSDIPLQMIPFRALVRDRLRHFEAPLWSNEMGTGQPLLGNAQSAPFSPLGLLALPLPPVRALPVEAALRLFLSLLLTDALLAALGAGRAGAVFAAIGFTFSVFSICWAYHPHGMAMAWLPGILLGVVLLHRGERGGVAGLAGCATGMALSGHPETLAHTALATAAVAAALLLRGGGVGRMRLLRGLAIAAALSAGLAAPVLLPVLEALPESARAQAIARSAAGVQTPPFAPTTSIVLVDPLSYGNPRDLDASGPSNYNELSSGYAGILALAFAIAAALVLRGRVLAIFLAGATALAAAFGVAPALAVIKALPLLDRAVNGRMRFLWVLAVAVAAGIGLEPLAARRGGRWAMAGCAGALGLALGFLPPPPAPWQRAWWLAAIAGCVATAAAFAWTAITRKRAAGSPTSIAEDPPAPRWLPWLAVACLALDLGLLNGRFLPILPARFDLEPPPAIVALQEARDAKTPFRVVSPELMLAPNLAAFYGLWDPRPYDPMQIARAALVTRRALQPHYGVGDMVLMFRRPLPLAYLSYLGVRYVLTRHRDQLPPPWEEAWDGPGGKIWRNPGALPLLFMPASWWTARNPRDALFATVANPDFAATAVVETAADSASEAPPPPQAPTAAAPPPTSAEPPRGERGAVTLRRVRANGFDLEAARPAGGLVVSSVSFCRGWRLAIDGHPGKLLRVNAGFLGFAVPAGWHRATLEYRPASWTWGLRLFGLTAVALLAAALRRGLAHRARALTAAD
jgi:hypothetical protein